MNAAMAARALRMLADALESPADVGAPTAPASKPRRRRRATLTLPTEPVSDLAVAKAREALRKAGIR